MATDNIAGHTAAQNTLGEDGLRDGDSLSPTTLTNLIQGVQGNGILRYQDGAYGSTRNETNSGNQPGSMVRASASTLTVSGGFAVLDGALYEFGTGVGNTITLDLNSGSHGSGALTLAANEEAIYTIYVAPSGGLNKVYYEGGSPVDTTTGLYPSASNQYLIDYDTTSTQDNMKAIVLAHVRVQYVGSGGGAKNLNIVEINDKRVFVEGSADYRVPLSTGSISSGEIADGGAQGINNIAHLNAIHNDNGELAITDTVNVHWVSHPRYGSFSQSPPSASDAGYGQGPSRGADRGGSHAADSFYFAGRNNEQTGHYSVRLQGRGVDATSTALTTNGTWVLTAEGDSFLMLSPNGGVTITLNPERDASANYKFPEGHIIEVCNDGTGDIVFDNQTSPSGLNATLSSGHRATFIYEGTVWVRCDYQSAIIANAPAIEISGGAPAFATGITQGEMLTLLGVEAGATADQTASEIRTLVESASDSNVFTDADHTKLNGIEASADVTDATNVDAAGAIMNSDVATKGQIIVGDGSGDPTILSVGTNGHVLTADSAEASGVKWAAGGGISSVAPITLDTSNNRVGVNEASPDSDLHVTSASTGNIFILECTDAGTASGPDISMIRNSASPAANDFLGRLVFKGKDASGNVDEYANIKTQLLDPTAGAEDIAYYFQGLVAGTNRAFLGLKGTGGKNGSGAEACINEHGIDMDFRVEANGQTEALFVQGSDGKVGINNNAPSVELDVTGSGKFSSNLEIDGALNHDGSTAGFFGTAPASKTTVAALGAQAVNPDAPSNPTAAEHASTQAAITALQGKLDALIGALSNLGLV